MSRSGKKRAGVCRYFAESGGCHYGEHCQFLHARPGAGFQGQLPSSGLRSFAGPQAGSGGVVRGGAEKQGGGGRSRGPGTAGPVFLPQSGTQSSDGGFCGMDGIRAGRYPGQQYGHSPAMHTFTAANLMSRLKIDPGGASSPRKNIANDIHRPQSLFGADKGRGGFAPVRPMGLGGVSSRAFFTSGSDMVPSGATRDLRAPHRSSSQTQAEAVGGTTYFLPKNHQLEHMPDHTYYRAPPPHVAQARGTQVQSLYPNPEIAKDLSHKSLLSNAQLPQDDTSVPPEVDHYHSLFPLEGVDATPPERQAHRTFGCASTCYKAIDARDGLLYVIRRIHGFKLGSTKAVNEAAKWKKVSHPNIVSLRELFTTKSFGDNSLVFVYDYHAGADTLLSRHFPASVAEGLHGPAVPVPEDVLWRYLLQLSSALTAVHGSGLAARFIHASKILVVGDHRILLSNAGIADILQFDGSAPSPSVVEHYQQEDLVAMGHLLVCLATGSLTPPDEDSYTERMSEIAANYSEDVTSVIQYLLHPAQMPHPPTVSGILQWTAPRALTALDSLRRSRDQVENELQRELDNGRLFRLLAKLGVVNERPEFNQDPNWAETGDRYLLKLFRDYLFHQVTPEGAPWVDLAHVVQSLNKHRELSIERDCPQSLDAGTNERICLYSRDGETVLIVSFAELHHCLEAAFAEVVSAGPPARHPPLEDGLRRPL